MCTQQLIIVGVMEESVYWVIWETNPLGLPSPIFPLGPPITSHVLQAFYTFAPKTSVESRTNFTDTTLSRWLSGYETILSQWRGSECWLRKKNFFFQNESRDQGNFGRNVKLCSILDTHCMNRRWYPKFSSQYFPWSYFWSWFIDWFCTSYN